MTSILQPFYNAIAWLVVHIHNLLTFLGPNWSWAAAIVLLTVFMRILMIPLFVKQIKSQRAMMAIQPQMKALQAKYKNDRQRQQEEMMKLYKDAGVNPFMGCLPLLPQIPIFFALFHTLDGIQPKLASAVAAGSQICQSLTSGSATYKIVQIHEMTCPQTVAAAHATIFGVPLAAAFNSPASLLSALNAASTSTRVLCAILTVTMVITTFVTQRQLMARNAATSDSPIAANQKIILYVLPLFFLITGYRFPVGVLLYWLTTNLWSMGQQFFVIRRMDASKAAPTTPAASAPSGPAPGARPDRAKPAQSATPPPATNGPPPETQTTESPASGTSAAPVVRPLPAGGAPGSVRPSGGRRPPPRRRPRNKRRRRA